MLNERRLLPISVQSFEKLRNNNCVYVDKTEYVYTLVHDVAQFFLGREEGIVFWSCHRKAGSRQR